MAASRICVLSRSKYCPRGSVCFHSLRTIYYQSVKGGVPRCRRSNCFLPYKENNRTTSPESGGDWSFTLGKEGVSNVHLHNWPALNPHKTVPKYSRQDRMKLFEGIN